jgi:general secretion pathway protein G
MGPARQSSGHTLVEMVVTISVLAIMAAAILPLAAMTRKREKEIQLRSALREIRTGLDAYHDLCKQSAGGAPSPQPGAAQVLIIKVEDDPGRTCWPKDLDVLVEGVDTNVPRYKLKFLRRIPKDPFNVEDEERDQHGWMLRSTTDRPESNVGWNKQNAFDVHSGSKSEALDGSHYEEW